jgi:hypothetical protein
MIGKTAKSAFGIVLATPDDMGYLRTERPEEAKPRARQNVVMEMGMLLAFAAWFVTRRRPARLRPTTVKLGRGWRRASQGVRPRVQSTAAETR